MKKEATAVQEDTASFCCALSFSMYSNNSTATVFQVASKCRCLDTDGELVSSSFLPY